MTHDFAGRVVMVTGCRGVIGEALCQFFRDRGARVIGVSRVAPAMEQDGFRHMQCDLSNETDVVKMFHDLDASSWTPDTVVMSAAAATQGMVALASKSEIERVIATNVSGAVVTVREALKRMMRKRFGRIIAISSIRVSKPERGTALYAASKAALEQLIKVLPFEVIGLPITFNAVELSLVSDGMADTLSTEARQAIIDSLAVKRPCTPQDLCNVVGFFAAVESEYLTGQVLKLGFV